MDSRTAGRHHTTRQWNQRYRPTLLLLDSPGPDFPGPDFPGDDGRAGAPGRPGPPGDAARRSPGGSPDRRRWLAMTASAVLVGLTVIAAFAGTAILRIAAGGHGTAPGLPIPTALPLPVIAPSGAAGAPAGPPPPRRAQHPPRHRRAVPAPSPPPSPPPAPATPSPAQPQTAAGRGPATVVTYFVPHRWPGGFEGQVQVTNNTAQPVSDWQIVVALPQDQITSFWNATGYVSNGILLLQPASYDQSLPPGGTLNVYFTAQGPETTPEACAFDGITCG